MKASILVMTLMVMSVFAGALTLAESGGQKAALLSNEVTASSEVAIDGSDDSDSEASLEMETSDVLDESHYKGFPAVAHLGNGWATDGSKGYLVAITGVSKLFVSKDTPSAAGTLVVRGVIRVGDSAFRFNGEQASDGSMGKLFSVYARGDGSSKDQIGTLELEKQTQYGDLTVYVGHLKLDSGVTYELHVAAKARAVKRSSDKGSDGTDSLGSSVRVECYDGVTETFALDGTTTDVVYAKAQSFCENHCKGQKCGVNSLGRIGDDGKVVANRVANTKGKDGISIDDAQSASATGEIKSDSETKGFLKFWKSVFSRSESKSA